MIRLCLFAFIFIFSTLSSAEINFEIADSKDLSIEQRRIILNFINEVSQKLPQNISLTLTKSVKISFKDLGGSVVDILNVNKKTNSRIVMGYVKKLTFLPHPRHIVLNKLLLEILEDENLKAIKTKHHQTAGQLVQAVLIHELSHVIDFNSQTPKDIKEDIENCRSSENAISYYFDNCQEALMFRGRYSDHPEFKKLIRWKQISNSVLGHPRSADSYEFKNSHEYFAVNFEYFILDPNFKCRKPSLYSYFSKSFKMKPFQYHNCNINTQVFTYETGTIIDLSPKKVLSIDYFHGGPGVALMSKWGHSMFRITICKDKQSHEQDCAPQNINHIILTFRANVVDTLISYWKGIKGDYPSGLFIMNYKTIESEYSYGELRDLTAYPLQLTEEQKKSFITKVLEIYWGYSGQYYFFSNNCAVEALSLLQSILPLSHPIQQKSIMKPSSLLKSLISTSLVSVANSTTIKSKGLPLSQSIKNLNLKSKSGKDMKLKEYLKLPPHKRAFLFNAIYEKTIKVKASFLFLEKYALYLKIQELYQEVSNHAFKNKIKYDQSIKLRNDWLLSQTTESFYGIPDASELANIQQVILQWEQLNKARADMFNAHAEFFPKIMFEIDQIKKNLDLCI